MLKTETKEKETYEDYAALPEGAPYELIDGELVMAPAPTSYHQIVESNLEFALQQFVREHKVGIVLDAPVDVYFSEMDTFQPDIIFIKEERRGIIGEQKIEGAPDLIVEVLSPSTAYKDLKQKRGTYEAAGVKEYWIVDPEAKDVEIYENIDGRFQRLARQKKTGSIASQVLDGFSITLDDLF